MTIDASALEDALVPLAAIADEYAEQEDDTRAVWLEAGPIPVIRADLTLKVFRAARSALAALRAASPLPAAMAGEEKRGNFIAVTSDEPQLNNFHTAIYEDDYKGLLICLCNQNGRYPWQATAILDGLNGKKQAADEIQRLTSLLAATPTPQGEAKPLAWTGSGSLRALEDGREGHIWPTAADAHPIPLYAAPPAWRDMESAKAVGDDDPPAIDLRQAHRDAIAAAEIFYDAASVEETLWTGWGEQIVPPSAEWRRVKAKQALSALRDAAPLTLAQDGER